MAKDYGVMIKEMNFDDEFQLLSKMKNRYFKSRNQQAALCIQKNFRSYVVRSAYLEVIKIRKEAAVFI